MFYIRRAFFFFFSLFSLYSLRMNQYVTGTTESESATNTLNKPAGIIIIIIIERTTIIIPVEQL